MASKIQVGVADGSFIMVEKKTIALKPVGAHKYIQNIGHGKVGTKKVSCDLVVKQRRLTSDECDISLELRRGSTTLGHIFTDRAGGILTRIIQPKGKLRLSENDLLQAAGEVLRVKGYGATIGEFFSRVV